MDETPKYIHLQSSAGKLAIHPSNLMSNHNNNTIYAYFCGHTTRNHSPIHLVYRTMDMYNILNHCGPAERPPLPIWAWPIRLQS